VQNQQVLQHHGQSQVEANVLRVDALTWQGGYHPNKHQSQQTRSVWERYDSRTQAEQQLVGLTYANLAFDIKQCAVDCFFPGENVVNDDLSISVAVNDKS
jgi:hypothetical protein